MDTELAIQKLRVDGFVILPDLLDMAKVAAWRDRFLELLAEKVRAADPNRGPSRYQMYLPFEYPFADPDLYQNPTVMPILEGLMGKDLACSYLASDTPLPGSEHQRVHSDTRLLFPETSLSLPAYGVVMNVPLVDFTEENGPLEIWPGGTHLASGQTDIASLAPEINGRRCIPSA